MKHRGLSEAEDGVNIYRIISKKEPGGLKQRVVSIQKHDGWWQGGFSLITCN